MHIFGVCASKAMELLHNADFPSKLCLPVL
jgi:hypothetical protein